MKLKLTASLQSVQRDETFEDSYSTLESIESTFEKFQSELFDKLLEFVREVDGWPIEVNGPTSYPEGSALRVVLEIDKHSSSTSEMVIEKNMGKISISFEGERESFWKLVQFSDHLNTLVYQYRNSLDVEYEDPLAQDLEWWQ